MPGLIGILSKSDKKMQFDQMCDCLNHFDYDTVQHESNSLFAGRVFLNYYNQDKSQHFATTDTLFVIVHGTFFSYNGKELPENSNYNDFLLEKYITDGISCLEKIDGHYHAIIFNSRSQKLYLITDRFGTLPLYYRHSGKQFSFAPEVKALLSAGFKKNLNYDTASELFHLGHVFGNKTFFHDIHQMPPASYLSLEDGSLKINTYWDYPYYEKAYDLKHRDKKTIPNLSEELNELMKTSFRSQSKYDANQILIPLSGGLDSRWVNALAFDSGKSPIYSFTMGEPDSEDRIYAGLVADYLKSEQKYFTISSDKIWQDAILFSFVSDGMSMISGPIQNFQPYRHYHKNKSVIITPQMCDAMFGSTLYRKRLKILMNKSIWDDEARDIFLNIFTINNPTDIRSVFNEEIYKKLSAVHQNIQKTYIDREKRPIHCYFKLLMNEHGRRGTLGGNLVNNLFFNTHMPSYNNEIVNFAFKLPIAFKINQHLYRYAFAQKFPDLAAIPREGTNLPINVTDVFLNIVQLENRIVNRAKKTPFNRLIKRIHRWNRPNYVSYAEWFRTDLRKDVESLLLNPLTYRRDIFDKVGIHRILTEHFSNQKDHSNLIWQIINLELFFRNFTD
jgi:asparagine synthetase B (glutamine-hydrolysing)